MAEASLLTSKSDQSWTKYIFLLTIHHAEFYQIPQKEVSVEVSMATSLVDVHLVQPITNNYCSTNICTYLMIKVPVKITRHNISEVSIKKEGMA